MLMTRIPHQLKTIRILNQLILYLHLLNHLILHLILIHLFLLILFPYPPQTQIRFFRLPIHSNNQNKA